MEDYKKKYEEALELMKDCIPDENGLVHVRPCDIFSELKESEDERIRISLIHSFECCREQAPNGSFNELPYNDIIAWLEKKGNSQKEIDDAYLKGMSDAKHEIEKESEEDKKIRIDIANFLFNSHEDIKDRAKWIDYLGCKINFIEKQGEQKPADEIEPKFKVGDTVRYKYNHILTKPRTIAEICGTSHYIDTDGCRMDMAYTDANFEVVENPVPSVWHDASERPDGNRYVLCYDGKYASVAYFKEVVGCKWAYVEDLYKL